jgi:transposase
VKAAQRNANLMSLVASAHRQDLDIAAYLESLITHQLRGTASAADCLPDVWKAHHPEAVRTYRVEERRYKADTAKLRSAKRKCESRSKVSVHRAPREIRRRLGFMV